MALMKTCPTCNGDAEIFRSMRGGNDPNGSVIPCPNDDCDLGEVPVWCDASGCREWAREWVTFPCGTREAYCSAHANEMRAEAEDEAAAAEKGFGV